MTSERIETWRMCQEASLYLLASLTPAQLEESYSKRTRSVADQFRHMHGVRLRWLEHAAPDCIQKAKKLERDAKTSKSLLKRALVASGKAIERYIVMPGQATAYTVGMLEILRLREKAKAALGDDFDLREFHDAVLLNGSVPLTVLEAEIDRYIEGRLAKGA